MRRLNEKDLETLIVDQMKEVGWLEGQPSKYNASYAMDLSHLAAFIENTQPYLVEPLGLASDSTTRHRFLARLQGEITKRGIVYVLRNGIDHLGQHVDLYYPTPSAGNTKATELFAANRFVISRQVHHSVSNRSDAIDLVAFVNGLPVLTFELKNTLTGQNYEDAVQQYQRDRDHRELLFAFGRTIAHFAFDDQRVQFCTHLTGKSSWFLPFDQGYNDGAGNPPNPNGIRTDYLWRRILAPRLSSASPV